ncbi:MAG TPA: transcription antitermination factor NusB [Lichenihabitans sp.]|nr:transcription antitermination factor NusB [Lichenihabitans sp.]
MMTKAPDRLARPRPGQKPQVVAPIELPPGLAPRVAAAMILADVVGQGRGLDEASSAAVNHPRLAPVSERDRALARSIVTVSLRRLGTIRSFMARFLEKGWPRKSGTLEWVLVATAAQILYLDIPDHAAVNACVQAVRLDPASAPFAALANAVARNVARHRDEVGEADPFLDTPVWLATRWRKTYGDDTAAAIAAAHRAEVPLDLTVKDNPESWAERLQGDVLSTGSIRLRVHTPVPQLPGYAEGAWWVQDAAASLPARLLKAEAGERVADLCAAPGGKTAQLCATGAEVVAVDRSAERLKRFALNLERLGFTAEAKVADVASFNAQPFDKVLLDAPCTATGTMRRHPDVGWTKRASDIPVLASLQSRMLDRAAALVRPGGRLVYCVCSLEPEEGEMQIAALLRRNPDLSRSPIDPDEIGGLTASLTALGELRTLPNQQAGLDPPLHGLDGFFAARLLRRA